MPNSPDLPRRRRVALVVDDYKDTADVLAELLDGCGFDASIAYTGEQALQIANAIHPDLIILDIGLPQRNGLEVCARVRREPWGAYTRIVAVTGQHLPPIRQAMHEAGFDEVLAKPCSFREISDVLEQQHH